MSSRVDSSLLAPLELGKKVAQILTQFARLPSEIIPASLLGITHARVMTPSIKRRLAVHESLVCVTQTINRRSPRSR
jgi:hypothetical protein